MINFVFEILCTFLIAMSFIFIVIEIRAKVHKRFLIFGISNLLLCCFCAIDIWILYYDPAQLVWIRLQHVVFLLFLPFITWHHLILVHKENITIVKIQFFLASIFSLAFFSDWMLIKEQNQIVSTFLYTSTFAPYAVIVMFFVIYLLLKNLKKAAPSDRKMFHYHLTGSVILVFFGALDLIGVIINNPSFITSFGLSLIGTLAYSLIATIAFIELLSTLIRDRESMFQKLRVAYKELKELQSLRELKVKNIEQAKANAKLEQMNKLMVGRELRMIELKKEIESLKKQAPREER